MNQETNIKNSIVEIGLANFITISKSFFSAPEQDVMKLFFSTTVQNFSRVCLFDCNFLNCFSLGRTGDGNVEEALEKKNKGLYPHVKIWFPENNSTSIIVSLRINIIREKCFLVSVFVHEHLRICNI